MLRHEGPRPGPGWQRHDWKRRSLRVVGDPGARHVVVARRRWRLAGTTTTRLDRAPDEVPWSGCALLVVFLRLASWLLSGEGVHRHEVELPALEAVASRRAVQNWLHRLLPAASRVEGALRTAAIERSEPRPVERLFPGGLSPPVDARQRRWKDPGATYRLATGLAILARGAAALDTPATVLLAEARLEADGILSIPRR